VKLYSESARPLFARHNPRLAVVRPYQIVTAACRPAPRDGGPLVVGFLGSAYKDAEFAPLLPALTGLLAAGLGLGLPRLRLELFGFVPEPLRGLPGVSVLPWESGYLDFRRRLDGLGWHLGLAPLRDNDFNRCKSNNRYREYAASSIAGVYSDAEIYRTTVAGGTTGIVVPHADTGAWSAALLALSDDARREAIIRNAHADVQANYRVEDYVAGVAALV
ncbi:MAG TPA: glycosyltransferase, partial [Thermoanaerobaculia bacterium]|nr:glycosyltransferase [Thermoanaerobaculia bacterium]